MDRHLPLPPDLYEMRRFPPRSPTYPGPVHAPFPHPHDGWNSRPPPRYELVRSPPRRFSPLPPPPGFPHGPPRLPLQMIRRSLSPPRSPHYRSPPRRREIFTESHIYERELGRPFDNNSPRNVPYPHVAPFPTNEE